jgi:hypothetical protein
MNRAADSRDASPADADPAVAVAKAFREVQGIFEEAYKVEAECFGRAAKHFPPMPPGIGMGWHLFNDDVIRSRHPMFLTAKDLAKTLERRNEYAKVRDEILARFDHPAMKAAAEAPCEEVFRLRNILKETKATSPAGVLAKLLIFAEISGDLEKAEDPACAEVAPPMLKSAIEDLKTMAGDGR